MKVEIGNPWSSVDAVQSSTPDAVQRPTRDNADRVDGDDASLSHAAVLAGTLRQGLDNIPETRSSRVEELRQRVQQGSYQVRSEQIAKALRDDLTGMNRIFRGQS